MTAYDYQRATWDEVRDLGAEGWRLLPLPPVVEGGNVLGQSQTGEPLYVMERETAPEPGPPGGVVLSLADMPAEQQQAVQACPDCRKLGLPHYLVCKPHQTAPAAAKGDSG